MSTINTELQQSFERYKCCVLIPTYNNEKTVGEVIRSVLAYTSSVVVVDDGSTDSTPLLLKEITGINVTTHAKNQGKGKALRTGFAYALSLGYEYAITIDSDGQHMATDLVKFIDQLETHPDAIMVGARNMDQSHIPTKSSFGNKFSNFWFKVETGITMPDTQSGYRLYPLVPLSKLTFFTRKFEFEIEVMVRGIWSGLEIISVPVKVYYAPQGERISHFRPFKDFSRISVLNTVLVTIALLWYYPLQVFRSFGKPGFWKRVYEAVVIPEESNYTKAASIGFGIFMGIFPVWGYQMLLAAGIAHFMKWNKALVLVSSNISIPPMIPFILFGSNYVGALLLKNDTSVSFDPSVALDNASRYLYQYILGSVVLATVMGILMFVFSFGLLSLFRRKKKLVI